MEANVTNNRWTSYQSHIHSSSSEFKNLLWICQPEFYLNIKASKYILVILFTLATEIMTDYGDW